MSMNFVTFNQDHSHLAVATSRGFRIFTTDPFAKCSESKVGDVSLLEMLFSTSLVALITSPRRLQIINTKRQSTICELTFPTTVLAVRLNRMRLVVVLEDQIYLYDISNMKLLHTIETSPNPQAICALSSSSSNCYLAYPLPQKAAPTAQTAPAHTPPSGTHVPPTSGDVLLFDASKLEAVNVVTAHRAPLCFITLNNTGTLLATSSDKGTIIRVFSVPKAEKLYQFRRGSMPSRIFSMSFNTTSSLLCVSSATETVHIFKLGGAQRRTSIGARPGSSNSYDSRDRSFSPDAASARDSSTDINSLSSAEKPDDDLGGPSQASRKHNGTFMGMIRRTSQNVGSTLASSVGSYLPTSVTEIWEPSRDFAWCKIPKSSPNASTTSPLGASTSLRSVVAMSSNSPQVMVVTNEGHFYVFGIDLEKGGEGTLVKTYEVASDNERMAASVVEE